MVVWMDMVVLSWLEREADEPRQREGRLMSVVSCKEGSISVAKDSVPRREGRGCCSELTSGHSCSVCALSSLESPL